MMVPLLMAAALTQVCAADRTILEGSFDAPANWALSATPARTQKMTVYLFLAHQPGAEARLQQTLEAVSDPNSPQYGQHLTMEEISSLLSPSYEHLALVDQWLSEHNVTQGSSTSPKDLVQLELTVEQAEAMFATQVHEYTHTDGVSTLRSTSGYSLPSRIASAVTVVGDLTQFPPTQKLPVVTTPTTSRALLGGGGGGSGKWDNDCTGASSCKGLVTPGVLRTRYKLPTQPSKVSSNSTMAVAEFQGQYYDDSDLSKFSSGCAISPAVKPARDVGKNVQRGGVESLLDIEYITAVANPIPLTVYYSGEYSLLNWIKTVGSTPNPGWVHSVSYGNDEVQQTSTDYMNQVNVQFQAIGARGISILFASGDQGVWGRSGRGAKFHPDFPGGSPYITVVGGTDFAGDTIGDETAWASGGGGFSDTFTRPSYQEAAVSSYLKDPSASLPPSSFYNASGRGYPDVAALGGQKNPYCVTANGRFTGVAGTSASSPVVAGVFALLNDLRLSNNKPPLGFLNPFIYQNADAFNDVTSGKNNAGVGNGFTAIKGWDAATGVGTPNYEALAAAVQKLP
jgi:tripeptidyl-peptidase-1